ncbi:hypothetical protein [Paraburkholderia sp. BL21I4N1]|uniref:hypothetical protein n=1 Tax=Paraburkholderia sp. BL21I4N1 TaxID=1938801 RepID=UPI000CFBFEAE|nr:hypothetical protein [Paraburkholderia sp. BL21I4N1]PQV44828.1 hypothetical protein B0G83_12059 [Paraburkholderia sp. BL21I4N1]
MIDASRCDPCLPESYRAFLSENIATPGPGALLSSYRSKGASPLDAPVLLPLWFASARVELFARFHHRVKSMTAHLRFVVRYRVVARQFVALRIVETFG